MRGHESVLLRWPAESMPLRVHLPAPPASLVEDPEATLAAVRRGVTDWADAAGEGLPRFRFVEEAGDADIPFVWEAEPSGDWYVAHCVLDATLRYRRFGVDRILVTTHWQGERVPNEELYGMVLHEMGHALGLGGHSPETGDAMYARSAEEARDGPSARDRETLRRLYASPIGKRVVGARDAD